MDALFHRMSMEEKDLLCSTYVLDNNCLDKDGIKEMFYGVAQGSGKRIWSAA
jgi:hypothetical protein